MGPPRSSRGSTIAYPLNASPGGHRRPSAGLRAGGEACAWAAPDSVYTRTSFMYAPVGRAMGEHHPKGPIELDAVEQDAGGPKRPMEQLHEVRSEPRLASLGGRPPSAELLADLQKLVNLPIPLRGPLREVLEACLSEN